MAITRKTQPQTKPQPEAPDEGTPLAGVDLETLGTAELNKLADSRGIDVGKSVRRSTLVAALKAGVPKPIEDVPLSENEIPDDPAAAAEAKQIDEELAALGDPQAKVAAIGDRLSALRETRKQTVERLDREIGTLLNDHRQAQKWAGRECDKIAALKARRARLSR